MQRLLKVFFIYSGGVKIKFELAKREDIDIMRRYAFASCQIFEDQIEMHPDECVKNMRNVELGEIKIEKASVCHSRRIY